MTCKRLSTNAEDTIKTLPFSGLPDGTPVFFPMHPLSLSLGEGRGAQDLRESKDPRGGAIINY